MSVSKTRILAIAAATLIAGGMASAALAQQPKYSKTYGQDRAEIEDLMARYLFAIDYSDWDAYVATLRAGRRAHFRQRHQQGREAIRKAVTSFATRIGEFYHTADGKPAKLRHVILQSSIRVEGDHAWARSLWLEMANHGPNDEPKIGTYGLYEDEMRKVGGQWLFSKRNVLNEFIKGRNSGPAIRWRIWTSWRRPCWPGRNRTQAVTLLPCLISSSSAWTEASTMSKCCSMAAWARSASPAITAPTTASCSLKLCFRRLGVRSCERR